MKRAMIAAALVWGMATALSAQPKSDVPIEQGKFQPNIESLTAWQCPDWFRDAKFGIWAHWGPQCQAEASDWYAQGMYNPDSWQFKFHQEHFGNQNDYGLKELCRDWKADKWNPDALVALYKDAGAKYFFTLGEHHDNFDLWDSPYQEWNSTRVGPMKDIVKGWADACKKYKLPFGVSFHGSHAWTWLEGSQDFDGKLTKADGAGQWWEGLDPQELYAQRHPKSEHWDWDWKVPGTNLPDNQYMMKLQNRVLQCINAYNPDIIYFDDTVLPFWQFNPQWGLNVMAHYYNHSANQHRGQQQVVVTGKVLNDDQKKFMLWDVERGVPDRSQPLPWQTCTCIGSWHYDRGLYNRGGYKSAGFVIRMLVDIVSKNGNLLLSVPLRGNGMIDEKEVDIVQEIGQWMKQNGESIYGTRPWKTFGEGPQAEAANPLNAQGFNEGDNYSNRDVRYNEKKGTVYATILRWPEAGKFTFKAFAPTAATYSGTPRSVRLLGCGKVPFTFGPQGLTVDIPLRHCNPIAPVFEIRF